MKCIAAHCEGKINRLLENTKLPCGHSLMSGRCDSALCWSTYGSAVAGGGDAALVVAPLAAVGVG